MNELDEERIAEFGFSNQQLVDLLINYQKNITFDCHELIRLLQEDNPEAFLSRLHAFKGMLSLFAKPSLVQTVAQIELDAQDFNSVSLVAKVEQLQEKSERLKAQVQAFLLRIQ
jgi:hypothetical protein